MIKLGNKKLNIVKFVVLFIVLILLILFLFLKNSKVTVLDFGAEVDDLKDDTMAIQSAINYQSDKGGGTVVLPKGTYLINSLKSVVLKDNITLEFKDGAILQSLPNGEERYEIVKIMDVKNVALIGDVRIIGERNEHLGTTGEWGFGISIIGSENITIENAYISDCWGDGIYIGSSEKKNYSKYVEITNPTLENNRRQGISVISVKGLKITDPTINNTNGTAPQSGIDIEPNFSTEYLKDIKIENLNTSNNQGYGLQIYLLNYKGSENPVNIEIGIPKSLPDGIYVGEYEGVKGEILVEDYFTHILK